MAQAIYIGPPVTEVVVHGRTMLAERMSISELVAGDFTSKLPVDLVRCSNFWFRGVVRQQETRGQTFKSSPLLKSVPRTGQSKTQPTNNTLPAIPGKRYFTIGGATASCPVLEAKGRYSPQLTTGSLSR